MKWYLSIFLVLLLGQSLKASCDSLSIQAQIDTIPLNIHVQIDTIQSYTKDSCLVLLTVYNNELISEKRNAILTWYKTKFTKEFREEREIKAKYGVNLELVNHDERIEYLENGQRRLSFYKLGDLEKSKLVDINNNEVFEESEYGIQEDGSIKLHCSIDILYVYIMAEYGFPRKIRNKRKAEY